MRVGMLLGIAVVLGGCASARQGGRIVSGIEGSSPLLEPRITGVAHNGSQIGGPAINLSYVAPKPGYASYLRVYTQASVSVLAAPAPATPTAQQLVDSGRHTLVLRDVPMFLRANARREPHIDPHEYVVVVMTSTPLSLADLQASLEEVDLRGSDEAVLARVARAVGVQSGAAWGASAVRSSYNY